MAICVTSKGEALLYQCGGKRHPYIRPHAKVWNRVFSKLDAFLLADGLSDVHEHTLLRSAIVFVATAFSVYASVSCS